jgi:hypothetical protein
MDITIRTVITIGRITAATITGLTMGTAGTAITTATTEITTIDGNKLTYLEIQIELAREQFRASFFFRAARMKIDDRRYFFGLGDSTDFVAGPLVGWSI